MSKTKTKTVIIDYGLGNLQSVLGALERLEAASFISRKPEDIQSADRLILPGVGAFGDGMRNLRELGLIDLLREAVLEKRKPILGICLGAQLMALEGFEFGHHQGLGWIEASVVGLEAKPGFRVPHVGWSDLFQIKKDPIFEQIPAEALFYYVHSFHIRCRDQSLVIGEGEYGEGFTAAFRKENIVGVQFHPEKSQQHGLRLLENFLQS